jgi:ribonuclease T1
LILAALRRVLLLAPLLVLLALAQAAALPGAAFARGDAPAGAKAGAVPEVALSALPPEARRTLVLIRQGGPFPYDRDGIVFNNREKLLPLQARGWYREYTVPTPGARNRGARRIVAAKSGEFYYTDDHYASFRRIRE